MDREIVERVAHIAHLDLTEEELERYSKDLSEILEYFQMLDIAPESEEFGFDPVEVADVLRDDIPDMEIPADALLSQMKTYNDFVRGPRIS
ncbi:MAG: Asp-tRNA(Asn)/Glu-tRNA(Gln) amidotransferase subunit GatC [Candidatus Methanomethylophilaceae archaeon]